MNEKDIISIVNTRKWRNLSWSLDSAAVLEEWFPHCGSKMSSPGITYKLGGVDFQTLSSAVEPEIR